MTIAALARPLRADPRRAFAIDGLGALLSAVTLGLVLPRWAEDLGVAASALRGLGAIAALLGTYDLVCIALRPRRWQLALRIIAGANAVYPLITVAALTNDGAAITGLGWLYFATECAIVLALAGLWAFTARSP